MRSATEGRELHREFVGMLFALAIGEVATDGAIIANSSVPILGCLPAYSHLLLAACIIAASWVGWGKSDHSLSNINSIFTFDFVELLVDLWLVVLYFFVVKAVELPEKDGKSIMPSAFSESKWLWFIFATYFVWDLVTKIPAISSRDSTEKALIEKNRGRWLLRDKNGRIVLLQRAWASLACAALSYWMYQSAKGITTDIAHVLLADLALLFLVLLFRAMKMTDLFDFFNTVRVPVLNFGLLCLFLIFFAGATEWSPLGRIISKCLTQLVGGAQA